MKTQNKCDESKPSEQWANKRVEIVDKKAERWNNELSIIVTAHHGQRLFMNACLKSLQGLGWILMVYDNPGDRYELNMPDSNHYKMIDQFFMKHITTEMAGPTYPQFWNYKHAVDILAGSNSEYVFTIGADSILERPEGLLEIAEMLGDKDIIACSTRNPKRHSGLFCGTKSFLCTKDAFKNIVNYIETDYVPFNSIGNMETRFGKAIKDLEINEVVVPELPFEDQFAHKYNDKDECIERGTWGESLGFRHLAGENKIRKIQKRKPVEEKYYDKKYMQRKEVPSLESYWKTGDRKFLEAWWRT